MVFKVSVVIPNYNYQTFVGAAIDSALAIDWPALEVIVVDDGSTDNSGESIRAYGDRIVPIFQQNSGQLAACINGFSKSTGDLVIFLDSDDLLDPSIIKEAAKVWRPGVSKIQFQMKTVDADGVPLGSFFPQYRIVPTSAQIRHSASTTGTYPTPPGSGNAYSREAVAAIFASPALQTFITDRVADTPLIAAAPYLGDVIVIAKSLVSYRIHGSNNGAMSVLDVTRFSAEISRATGGCRFAQRMATAAGIKVKDDLLNRSLWFNPYRLASFCLARDLHPIAGDTRFTILMDTLKAAFTPQGLPVQSILLLVGWTTTVVMSPQRLARSLVLWRFASSARPRSIQRVLKTLRIIR